jgi:hypothetical protein
MDQFEHLVNGIKVAEIALRSTRAMNSWSKGLAKRRMGTSSIFGCRNREQSRVGWEPVTRAMQEGVVVADVFQNLIGDRRSVLFKGFSSPMNHEIRHAGRPFIAHLQSPKPSRTLRMQTQNRQILKCDAQTEPHRLASKGQPLTVGHRER